MTAVLSSSEVLALPRAIREQLHLQEGDDFDILVEDDETIVLRRKQAGAEMTWLELLRACPGPLEIPERVREDSPPLEL